MSSSLEFYKPLHNKAISEVRRKMNTKLKKDYCYTQNVTLINKIKMRRDYHTKHGLHLNLKGKKLLCKALAKTIVQKVSRKLNHKVEKSNEQ